MDIETQWLIVLTLLGLFIPSAIIAGAISRSVIIGMLVGGGMPLLLWLVAPEDRLRNPDPLGPHTFALVLPLGFIGAAIGALVQKYLCDPLKAPEAITRSAEDGHGPSNGL